MNHPKVDAFVKTLTACKDVAHGKYGSCQIHMLKVFTLLSYEEIVVEGRSAPPVKAFTPPHCTASRALGASELIRSNK